jgi:replicative DNA helicase
MAVGTAKEKDTARLEPPHDTDAEQAVLGSILKDERALFTVIDKFKSTDYFYYPKHQIIFRAILNLFEKKEPPDITTVADELTKMDELEKIGGRLYLIDLVDGIATTANVASHAGIVVEKALLRKLIDTSNSIITKCVNLQGDVDTLLDLAETKFFSIKESGLKTDFTALKELIPHTFEQIEDFQETKGGLTGIETGFEKLDAMTAGLHDGDFVVIAGRPSMGKTALALNIAEHVAIANKIPVGIFSVEMTKEQLALRLLCGRAKISQHLLRTNRLKDSDWQRLSLAGDPLSEAEIYIDDSGTLSTLELRAKARRLKAQHDIGLLIVDYIQLMHSTGRIENRQQEMAMISRGLKSLAKELQIPVVACSQLSRMVEMRGGDKRPQLSDLRESGAIEQDADVVMFVYRREFYLSHLDREDARRIEVEGKAEIIVAKQRNGPTGRIDLAFVKDYVRFESLATRYDGAPEPEGDIPF